MIGNHDFNQLVSLLAVVLVVDAGLVMSKTSSPKVEINPLVEPKEEIELLRKFMEFNPELQRGMLSYAERMRKGYGKDKG